MRKLVFILGMMMLCTHLLAQERTIRGRVLDESGKGVFGASVLAKGSQVGVVTSENGEYVITVPAGTRSLIISGIGFIEQEVAITASGNLNITLKQDTRSLEGVVVTGYTREKKSQFAGASATIPSKAVETVPVGSFDQALQGQAPGLLVNSSSGQPGSSPNLVIRGIQSIQGAGAQPLFIIDGVPMPAGDMQTLNPNDFESITILKDANAAALYGARGGTGVIVITTKKGRIGQTTFNARSQYGITVPPDFSRLNLMNTAEILEYEERMGLGGAPTNTPGWVYSKSNPVYATLSPTQQARYDFILDSIRQINSDWRDILYRNGRTQMHELSMSGGNDRSRIYLSAGIFDQQGIDLGSDLRRYTTRFNIDHTANKVSVIFNTTAGFSETNFSEGEWLGNSPRNPFQMTYRAKTYENPFKPDGSLNFGSSTSLNLKQVANLLEGIENSNWQQKQIKLNSGLTVVYRVLSSLSLRNTLGVDVSSNEWQRFVRPGSYIGSLQQYQSGAISEASSIFSQIINTTSLIYSNQFADVHDIEVGGYFETVRGYTKAIGFSLFNLDPRLGATGQGVGALPTNGAATMPQNASSARSGYGIRSYFGTARYTYDGRYTANFNVRRDGTSRIVNEENREITTWSAGLIWNALREKFMESQRIFSDLRLRLSYGVIPNIGSIATAGYGITGGIVSVTNYQGPQVPSYGTTNYAGSLITGIAPSSPGNPNYKIERIQKANIGLDFAVWQNRARFIIDFYRNRTVDLFVRQPLSGTTGFGSLDINAGIMSNKGVELSSAFDVVKSRDWNITISWNHAINKNEIEDLGLVNEYFLGTFVIREGLPYGSHYTYHYLGADPTTGRPMYEAPDGSTVMDVAQAGQFAKFGTYLPKHVGGFNADIRFRRFSVFALFSYQFDVVRSNNIRNWITRGTPGYHAAVNASRELLTNQWEKPGDQKFYQGVRYDRGFTSSDLEDAKFLRFRNLNISYSIPQIRIGGITAIKSARVYVQGQNLAIWSPWRGHDPEDGNNISLNEYPNPTMYVAGIDINF